MLPASADLHVTSSPRQHPAGAKTAHCRLFNAMHTNDIKVLWRLEQDEDEWPPYPVESVWCEAIAPGRFKLLNVPYFAHGVAWGDVVTAVEEDDGLWFESVIQRSGFVTLHVYCKDPAQQAQLRGWLQARDCIVETAFGGKYWALGIPPAVPRREWEGFLTRLAREDGTGLEFDVACPADEAQDDLA